MESKNGKTVKELRGDLWDKPDSQHGSEDGQKGSENDLEPDLDWAYESLENLVRMVTRDYEDLVILSAKGGIGKTYNVKKYLREELGDRGDEWMYKTGYSTPLSFYKLLYRGRDKVLFLDDMSGVSKNDKCMSMLKSATETEGDRNYVSWESTKDIEDKYGNPMPKSFCFEGKIILAVNKIPNDPHFDALKTRGQHYNISFSREERLRIVREVTKNNSLALDYETRKDTVDWLENVTGGSERINIRTLIKVLNIREADEKENDINNWRKTALETLNVNYEEAVLVRLFNKRNFDKEMNRVERFREITGRSQGHYYNLKRKLEEDGRI